MSFVSNTRVQLYQAEGDEAAHIPDVSSTWLVKVELFLADRPGSLANVSSFVAEHHGNIGFFHYNRSIDANKVTLQVSFTAREEALSFVRQLRRQEYDSAPGGASCYEVSVTTGDRVLEVRVRLVDEPGSLAAFSRLLKNFGANVLYMLYNEAMDAESVDITLATPSPDDVDALLGALNEARYHYRVVYRGSGSAEVERVIGLKAVERFFLKLRSLTGKKQTEKLMEIVASSARLHSGLVNFYAEAGKYLEQGDVFENVLAFATISVANTGECFRAVHLPVLHFGAATLHSFRMPTGANIYVLDNNSGQLTLFDCGYGIYYEDLKKLLRDEGMRPSHVRRVFLTHADADHAGTSGFFEEEFGARVYLHPGARRVLDSQNRAAGAQTRLVQLNEHFTFLVHEFTGFKAPLHPREFAVRPRGTIAGFNIIDRFHAADLSFEVIESLGGHVPGQVFFFNRAFGLLFTSDYLLDVASLSPEEQNYLRLPRYLMTSTNTNSDVFRKETAMLRGLVREENKRLGSAGRSVRIFPGHGDYYQDLGG